MRSLVLCLILGLALGIGGGCSGCGDEIPPDDTFDGNVIYGDATPAPDLGAKDAELDAMTSSIADAGDAMSMDGDAEVPDMMIDAGRDAEIDCSPNPVATVTATEAVARAADLANLFIEVTGTATATPFACTGCADAGACTCTCTATASIDGMVILARSECFDAPGCFGDECTQVCRPPILGVEQHFRGRLNVRNSGPEKSVALELFSVSP